MEEEMPQFGLQTLGFWGFEKRTKDGNYTSGVILKNSAIL